MIKVMLLSLLLVGCSMFQEPEVETKIVYRKQQIVCDDAPKLASIEILPVEFINATSRKDTEVLGLDGENYTNLSINTRSTIEYIKSQKAYLSYYTGCIIRYNKAPE